MPHQKENHFKNYKPHEVNIGGIPLGANQPLRLQSMLSTDPLNVKACTRQIIALENAGADYIRLTIPSVKSADALAEIYRTVRKKQSKIPLIADVHFIPRAAFLAAEIVEKVRINPGNFAEYLPGKKFATSPLSEEEKEKRSRDYLNQQIIKLIKICKKNGTALRIGVNYGSLSSRMINRYGRSTEAMAASALEYIEIFEQENFYNTVLSMKSSNVSLMVEAYKKTAEKLLKRDHHYPLHLGVTEAGFGLNGRIKSAFGLGLLLNKGLGNTIRISLTEDPVREIPAARVIKDFYSTLKPRFFQDPEKMTAPCTSAKTLNLDKLFEKIRGLDKNKKTDSFYTKNIKNLFAEEPATAEMITTLLLAEPLSSGALTDLTTDCKKTERLKMTLLKTAGLSNKGVEIISCPTCGRTGYNVQKTAEEIYQKTEHLNGITIAVMGCIVNGPGEMAGSDYGYIGDGKGTASLYRKGTLVEKKVPEAKAVDRLLEMIRRGEDL